MCKSFSIRGKRKKKVNKVDEGKEEPKQEGKEGKKAGARKLNEEGDTRKSTEKRK